MDGLRLKSLRSCSGRGQSIRAFPREIFPKDFSCRARFGDDPAASQSVHPRPNEKVNQNNGCETSLARVTGNGNADNQAAGIVFDWRTADDPVMISSAYSKKQRGQCLTLTALKPCLAAPYRAFAGHCRAYRATARLNKDAPRLTGPRKYYYGLLATKFPANDNVAGKRTASPLYALLD